MHKMMNKIYLSMAVLARTITGKSLQVTGAISNISRTIIFLAQYYTLTVEEPHIGNFVDIQTHVQNPSLVLNIFNTVKSDFDEHQYQNGANEVQAALSRKNRCEKYASEYGDSIKVLYLSDTNTLFDVYLRTLGITYIIDWTNLNKIPNKAQALEDINSHIVDGVRVENIRNYYVFKVNIGGMAYVLKRIDRYNRNSNGTNDLEATKFDSPHIVKIYFAFERTLEDLHPAKVMWYLSEYLEIDLEDENIRYDKNGLRRIIHDVLLGLDCLHRQGYCHRDIHIGNVRGTRGPTGKETFKLIDFGYCKRLEDSSESLIGIEIVTVGHLLGCLKTRLLTKSENGYSQQYAKTIGHDINCAVAGSEDLADFHFACLGLVENPPTSIEQLLGLPFIKGSPSVENDQLGKR
ncbi:uncharacterized protein VICG_01156 [Vittaforma corneae ATCC 50505]|uniref:Protein kinase domain-containing protein n=1 Tax=Vittaforma corneae (strain ATCC 50505) TaxID=993615 RepID=L2GME0_VITCO|nr:uncharacterized protein VICG_01156 [Vittaforma corneae ATCC 50505]ELA41804.1 hypothetical protein VICG_01156 [Vittaforma corneae ATCC 50505]